MKNRLKYLELALEFVGREVGGAGFVKGFLRLWREDRDAQWALKAGWDEPLDEQLIAAFQRKEIGEAQFRERWNELWGYRSEREVAFVEMLDRIFTACDLFTDEPRSDADPETEYDEDRLRSFVARELESYIHTLSEPTGRRAVG